MERELRYKTEVEKTGEYEYIRSYRKHDVLPSGRIVGDSPYIQVKHKYCGCTYEILATNFINRGDRCRKCCGSYENSFAYHIEVELGLKLEDVWDFEKNTVSPYHVSKGYTKSKVWLKCQKVDYHGSYETFCGRFIIGKNCSYCGNHKVHPKDSFAAKYPDKAKCWHEDNDKSPYEVSHNSRKTFKFKCDKCDREFDIRIDSIVNQDTWCECSSRYKGEIKISNILKDRGVRYTTQKTFDKLLGLGGGKLSYDFYLPDYNLLIEYQGEQHEKYIPGLQKDISKFKIQKEHDKLKRNYAKEHNIELLEIWHYDFDNIECILKNIV